MTSRFQGWPQFIIEVEREDPNAPVLPGEEWKRMVINATDEAAALERAVAVWGVDPHQVRVTSL